MTNTPAFPTRWYNPNIMQFEQMEGMMLRDYFAAQAMPALMASFLAKDLDLLDPHDWMDGLAMDAYSMADAMMKQRSEK
jgi:hypothetical protein